MKNKNSRKKISYKDSGVDILAGEQFIKSIRPLALSTSRKGSLTGLGGFAALFDLKETGYKDPILVAATDGVGTKLKVAIDTGLLDFIGIDLVAMCVNDLVCQGAEPLFFLDYLATGKLDIEKSKSIVKGIADGCIESNVALIGGETAEMPGIYQEQDFDLAGFSVGALERGTDIPRNVSKNDILIGINSSGLHSNGYSLVRLILEKTGLSYNTTLPGSELELAQELTTPTKIYVKTALKLKNSGVLKALAHITGGGISENLPRILPNGLSASIDLTSWETPSIFRWLFKQSQMEPKELLKTFNCGIGMIAVVAEEHLEEAFKVLTAQKENFQIIGKVHEGANLTYFGELV